MLIARIALIASLVGCVACVHFIRPMPPRPDADAKLRAFAKAELADAQRLLKSADQRRSDRISLALLHLANAETALILPRDAKIAAEVHVWTGIAHMQAGRVEMARQELEIAKALFVSAGAEHEAEGVAHLLRR